MDLAQQELTKRPFFSVVISCYNSRNTLGDLLQSLTEQSLEKDDLEVIISDDCSTESYEDIVEQFQDLLNIKRTQTKYNCCPSNTREAGAQIATGQWLTFSDHDDIFVKDALNALKSYIEQSSEKYCIYTSFYELKDDYTTVLREVRASESGGWTHGKFYNLDNLWKKYNIHYLKDLLSHEDVYLTCRISTVLDKLHFEGSDALTYLDDLFTYCWVTRMESQSHQYDDSNYNFLELHFIDYVKATGECYLNAYYTQTISYAQTKKYLLDSILLYYFYTESFCFYHPNNFIQENIFYLRNFINTVKELFDLNNNEIWQYAADQRAFAYKEALKSSEIGTGGFIPTRTFKEWLEYIDDDLSIINESPYYKY